MNKRVVFSIVAGVVVVRHFDLAAPTPFAQQPATNAAHGESGT
jgi:hypothetical protein